jgi:N6-adenosine-specific RNA methylase IME4
VTDKPTAPELHPENIPDELKAKPRWVGYRSEDKRYVSCCTGNRVFSESEEDEFVSFDEAIACHKEGVIDGIAYVVAEDDSLVVLEDVLYHPDTKEGKAGEKLVRTLQTYTEYDDERADRVKLLAYAEPRAETRATRLAPWPWKLESGTQLIRLSGRHVEGTPRNIENRQRKVDDLWDKHFKPTNQTVSTSWSLSRSLSIRLIRRDCTQVRKSLNKTVVANYAEKMKLGTDFPAIIVYHDAASNTYWLADGFHRIEAATKVGLAEITAEVRSGTQRDAILHAVEANLEHGFPMTPADKKHAAMILLTDPEWASWSSREIGRRCGLNDKTVERLRKASSADIPQIRKAKRKGRIYNVDTTHIGAAPAGTSDPRPNLTPGPEVVVEPERPLDGRATQPDRPRERFSVIVAAPPWSEMSLKTVLALPLGNMTGPDGIVFLWVDNEHLADAFEAIRAWGFTYKGILTWTQGFGPRNGGLVGPSSQCLIGVKQLSMGPKNCWGHALLQEEVDDLRELSVFWDFAENFSRGRKAELFVGVRREGWVSLGDGTGAFSWTPMDNLGGGES